MEIDYDNLPPAPRRVADKLTAIRAVSKLSADEFAKLASNGAKILSYENDEGDLPVRLLFRYAKLAGIPFENLFKDGRDLWLGHRQN